MSENEPSNRRRAKRFLSPSQKYEIWLQLVRQEATVAEVASAQQVDRSTIMRIKQVAKEGALSALAASKPGVKARGSGTASWRRRGPRSPGCRRRARSSRSSSRWWREKAVGADRTSAVRRHFRGSLIAFVLVSGLWVSSEGEFV